MSTCLVFDTDGRSTPDELDRAIERTTDGFVWVDVTEPTSDDLDLLAERYGLHPLALEDARHAGQRPKLERYSGMTFVVLRPVRATGDDVEVGELHVFVGDDFLVTVRHRGARDLAGRVVDEVRTRLDRGHAGGSVALQPDDPVDLLHALVDRVVDGMLVAVSRLEDRVELLEDCVFTRAVERDLSEDLYAAKRDVLSLWYNARPLADAVEWLSRPENVGLEEDRPDWFFRDVADHLRRVVDRADTLRDLLTDALDANLARISMRQNADMRKMSAWGALFLLPSVLVGLWGMNFTHMPELDETWGYPFALATIAVSCGLLWWRMRRAEWL